MFDVWMGDIELTTAVLIFSVVVLLPIQLLLCFRVKSKAIRLLPVVLLSSVLENNKQTLEMCRKHNLDYFLIDEEYPVDLEFLKL